MRKTSFILIFVILLSIFTVSPAFAEGIYEERSEGYIADGITLTSIKRLNGKGWYDINYITVDLNKEEVGFRLLNEDNITERNTVLGFTKKEEDVVAAINGDFFTTYGGDASPEGMMIKDSKLYMTPSTDPKYSTLTMDSEGLFSIDSFTFDIMVTSKRTNDSSKILFYNKLAHPTYLKIYDSSFGKLSPGSMEDGYEVVVEDGVVTGVYSNKEGVEIPENGYVLHNSLRYSLFLSENFQVGDEVGLSFSLSPDIENIKEAIGGGTVLLKNGEIAPFTLSDSVQPMTAVGIDETGKKLILFTVNGRTTYSRGMSFTEIATFLKELGCYSALSFDGGGSTDMAASYDGNEIKNIYSRSSYRKVINGIGITAERKENGDFKGFNASLSEETIFPGLPVKISIDSAFDEYGNSFELNTDKIKYSTDSEGTFQGNLYIPEKSGKHIISVTYEKVTRKLPLFVCDEATRITSSVKRLEATKSQQDIKFYIENDEGYSHYIGASNLDFEFEGTKGLVAKDKVTLTTENDGLLTATYRDASISIPIGEYEFEAPEVKDKFQKETDKEGFTFAVFGVNDNEDTIFTNYVTGKRNIIANACDLSAFKYIPEEVSSPSIRVTNYGREDTDHSLFIKLDNSKGSITSTKPEQWDWLSGVFKKGVKQKNVFITMPLDISKHSDEKELKIFTELLKENLKDKNIFIITFGNDNIYEVKDGIRYITTSDIPKFSYENPQAVLNKLKYAAFTITEDEVYFSFKPVI
ncbi:MAG: phosphodiester glycosidase family protein [Ruminococcaceae bacterium]|nr:phosphodiester glycosidase family protein [Oscillospiraceae bacterium]